ncbi:MAG: NIL domain-containing protein [Thermodesulfobacteriota bacterium]
MKRKVYLTYPPEKVKEPLLCQCVKKFNVLTNVRQASVTDKIGIVALELEGEPGEIEKAIDFFTENGVKVEPIEMNIIE